METKKRKRLKRFNIHPILAFILLTFFIVVLSKILSLLNLQTTYNVINANTLELETKIVSIKNMLSYDGLKFLISDAANNFLNFAPLNNLLIILIGLSVAHATGLIDTFTRRITLNIDNKMLTFIIIFLATISSLVNDIGYVVLIPLAALIFSANGRNPLLGVVTAFSGVAFGYGTTMFVGSQEVGLIQETTKAARLIDNSYHVGLSSNLIIMIVSAVVMSIIGTVVIEKIIAPKMGKRRDDDFTKEIDIEKINNTEQHKLELEYREKKGLRKALFATIIFLLVFAYMLIPNLPFSGILLDMSQKNYIDQVFGSNSYFQNGFTYMISLMFVFVGIVYGVTAKTITNDKDLIKKAGEYLKDVGTIFILMFFASQFISIFKETNIGTFITAMLAKMISQLSFSGIPLIVITMLFVAISGLFLVSPVLKWSIFAPIVVPLMLQSNIEPAFAQFIFRASDSMTKGITPLLSFFTIYIGYLNIYNTGKRAITIKKGISYLIPYFLIISLAWILFIIGWYLLGIKIGIDTGATI